MINFNIYDNDVFSENIKKILDQFSYNMWLIKPDLTMQCTCVNQTTKAAEQSCPKCLGIGYRIRIKKIKGVNRSNKMSYRTFGASETGTTDIFYFNDSYSIQKDDRIVDEDGIYIIERFNKETAENNKVVYYRAEANPLKTYVKEITANFNKIIEG